MEKVRFENSKGKELVGNIHLPEIDTDKAVIIAHGFASSKDRERRIRLAESLCSEGYGVLRFNFGGSEGSYKTDLRPSYQVDDLKSAIGYMKNRGYNHIGLTGESLGGLISIMSYQSNVDAMVLYAPVTQRQQIQDIKKLTLKGRVEGGQTLGENGEFFKEGIDFKLGKEYFAERDAYKAEDYIPKIKCPVLILHGDHDKLVPLEHSRKAIELINNKSRLIEIEGGEHVLEVKDGIIDYTRDWFKKYL